MSKTAILRIGTCQFALPGDADALLIYRRLAAAQLVDQRFEGNQKLYAPSSRQFPGGAVSLEYIDAAQLLPAEPRKRPAGAPTQAPGGSHA